MSVKHLLCSNITCLNTCFLVGSTLSEGYGTFRRWSLPEGNGSRWAGLREQNQSPLSGQPLLHERWCNVTSQLPALVAMASSSWWSMGSSASPSEAKECRATGPALSLPLQTEINNPLHKAAVKIKLGYRYKAHIRMIGTREELRNDEPPLPFR